MSGLATSVTLGPYANDSFYELTVTSGNVTAQCYDALINGAIPSVTIANLGSAQSAVVGSELAVEGVLFSYSDGEFNPSATGKSTYFASGMMTVQKDCNLHIASGSILDFSGIPNTAIPAGSNGSVIINSSDASKLAESGAPTVEKRFSVATWVPDSAYIPLPSDKAAIDAGISHIKKCGYNAIRIHGVENWLMGGQDGSVSFNPARLDSFYYFLAECKRVGLYWIINPQSYNLYTDMDGATNRFSYTSATNCKPRIYVEQDIRDNWKAGFVALYLSVNPYTGISTIQDPALAQIELFNESGVAFVAAEAFPSQWKTRTSGSAVAAKTWVEWLSDTTAAHGYTSLAALNTSWGTSHASYAAAADQATPALISGMASTQQSIDAVLYGLFLEDDLAAFYQACLTEWGYTGLSCMHNLFPNNIVSRNVGKLAINKVCNTHGYPMLAPSLTNGASLSKNNGPIWESESWLVATSMMGSGKPKWYGEHGWPAWGKYRNQYPILYAMAGMQGAVAVSYFSQGDFFAKSYNNDTSTHGQRIRRIEPYHNPSDPINDFTRVLQAVLFARKDISESSVTNGLILNDRYYGVAPRNAGRIIRACSYLYQPLQFSSALSKTSLNYTADTTDDTLAATYNAKSWLQLLQDAQTAGAVTSDNLSLTSATTNNGAISAVATTGSVAGGTASVTQPILTIGVNTLVNGDVIFITNLTGSTGTWPATNNKNSVCIVNVLDATHIQITSGLNLTGLSGANFTAGSWCEGPNILQSGTKEWGMSRRLGFCWIDTAKTKYIGNVSAALPVALSGMSVSDISKGAALFITSIDGNPLSLSKRMLIGLVGNSKNSGMTFTDSTEKTLVNTGDYPILTDDVTCSFRLNNIPSGTPILRKIKRDGSYANYQPERVPVDTTGVYVAVRSDVCNFWELVIK